MQLMTIISSAATCLTVIAQADATFVYQKRVDEAPKTVGPPGLTSGFDPVSAVHPLTRSGAELLTMPSAETFTSDAHKSTSSISHKQLSHSAKAGSAAAVQHQEPFTAMAFSIFIIYSLF